MALSVPDLLASINAKCDILSRRCRDLQEHNRVLQMRLEEAETSLSEARKEAETARRQLNYRSIASNYDSGIRDSSRGSSKVISDMVRKIDRCISRLEAE